MRRTFRRWLFPALFVLFLAWVIANRAELGALTRTLVMSRWQWVALAVLLQAGYYVVYAGLYRLAFARVGVTSRLGDTLPVLLGSLFVNLVAPSAGAAGAALFVDDAGRRGQSRSQAAAGVMLAMATDLTAIAALSIASLAYLSRRRALAGSETIGLVALVLAIGALVTALTLGPRRPQWVRRALGAVQSAAAAMARRFRRPPPLAADWAERTTRGFVAASGALRARPFWPIGLLALALGAHLLSAGSLGALFLAFHQPFRPEIVLTGYALGLLAWIVSPAPQGVGVVEATIALVLSSLGVPTAAATLIAVSFRGLTFWLPMAVGLVVARRLRSLRGEAGRR